MNLADKVNRMTPTNGCIISVENISCSLTFINKSLYVVHGGFITSLIYFVSIHPHLVCLYCR